MERLMCIKTLSSPANLRLTALSTTETFHPTTPWMPVSGFNNWAFNLMIAGISGGGVHRSPGLAARGRAAGRSFFAGVQWHHVQF
ncbi:MAG: hypothetical protein R3F61_36385 [Myxococcota bacterium]